MRAIKVYYKKLFNLGNFQNEEIGIEIEIEEKDKAEEAIKAAREFVNNDFSKGNGEISF